MMTIQLLLLGACAVILVSCQSNFGWEDETELDRYVNWDDGYYSWTPMPEYNVRYDESNVTVYVLNMTSQKWPMNMSITDRPIWWHAMGISVPDTIVYPDTAFIWVGEQSNDDPLTDHIEYYNLGISRVTKHTGMIGAFVLYIPNQPLIFSNYPIPDDGLSEDDQIAWTWRTFLDSPEPVDFSLPARQPMTKAAKRGVDALQEYVFENFALDVANIYAFGASKRGWTVWSLAAVDPRIKFATPIVCNLLNMPSVITRQFESLNGAWSFAFEPYWEWPPEITTSLFHPRSERLYDIEDMYRYRSRLTMPKMMIVSSGDEFFFLDNTYVWWNDMPAPMHIYLVENTEHILFPQYGKVFDAVISSWLLYTDQQQVPHMDWEMGHGIDGAWILLTTTPTPDELVCWRAETVNQTRRDFRLVAGYPDQYFTRIIWENDTSIVHELSPGFYRIEDKNVEDKWVGFFCRATWYTDYPGTTDDEPRRPFYQTTEAQITKDIYPGAPCTQDPDCYGYLV